MCEICDENVHTCNNCYWGQIDSKTIFDVCEDCVQSKNHVMPTEWSPLGDTYCRKCGRKLKDDKE